MHKTSHKISYNLDFEYFISMKAYLTLPLASIGAGTRIDSQFYCIVKQIEVLCKLTR